MALRVELTVSRPLHTLGAMKIVPVLCQRCGAPLDVADESVRFVTCAHCSTPLEIVRDATQSHSKILEQIQAFTAEHSRRLEVIELQNELERLDREWTERRMTVGRDVKSGCDVLGLIWLAGVFGMVIGIPMVVSCLYHGLHDGAVQGAIILGAGAALAVLFRRRASFGDAVSNELIAAENDHRIQRQSLLSRIEEAKRSS